MSVVPLLEFVALVTIASVSSQMAAIYDALLLVCAVQSEH